MDYTDTFFPWISFYAIALYPMWENKILVSFFFFLLKMISNSTFLLNDQARTEWSKQTNKQKDDNCLRHYLPLPTLCAVKLFHISP